MYFPFGKKDSLSSRRRFIQSFPKGQIYCNRRGGMQGWKIIRRKINTAQELFKKDI